MYWSNFWRVGVAVNPVFRVCSAQSKNEKILLFDFLREEMVTKEFFVSFDKINIIIKELRPFAVASSFSSFGSSPTWPLLDWWLLLPSKCHKKIEQYIGTKLSINSSNTSWLIFLDKALSLATRPGLASKWPSQPGSWLCLSSSTHTVESKLQWWPCLITIPFLTVWNKWWKQMVASESLPKPLLL